MSEPIEPRVRYQAQIYIPERMEWWDEGYAEKQEKDARYLLGVTVYAPFKKRIVKTTTTFEVVEEMEPK